MEGYETMDTTEEPNSNFGYNQPQQHQQNFQQSQQNFQQRQYQQRQYQQRQYQQQPKQNFQQQPQQNFQQQPQQNFQQQPQQNNKQFQPQQNNQQQQPVFCIGKSSTKPKPKRRGIRSESKLSLMNIRQKNFIKKHLKHKTKKEELYFKSRRVKLHGDNNINTINNNNNDESTNVANMTTEEALGLASSVKADITSLNKNTTPDIIKNIILKLEKFGNDGIEISDFLQFHDGYFIILFDFLKGNNNLLCESSSELLAILSSILENISRVTLGYIDVIIELFINFIEKGELKTAINILIILYNSQLHDEMVTNELFLKLENFLKVLYRFSCLSIKTQNYDLLNRIASIFKRILISPHFTQNQFIRYKVLCDIILGNFTYLSTKFTIIIHILDKGWVKYDSVIDMISNNMEIGLQSKDTFRSSLNLFYFLSNEYDHLLDIYKKLFSDELMDLIIMMMNNKLYRRAFLYLNHVFCILINFSSLKSIGDMFIKFKNGKLLNNILNMYDTVHSLSTKIHITGLICNLIDSQENLYNKLTFFKTNVISNNIIKTLHLVNLEKDNGVLENILSFMEGLFITYPEDNCIFQLSNNKDLRLGLNKCLGCLLGDIKERANNCIFQIQKINNSNTFNGNQSQFNFNNENQSRFNFNNVNVDENIYF